jgi:mono/diheme cytochrome c family protein
MKMPRSTLLLAFVLDSFSLAALAQTPPKGDEQRGRKVYIAYGCYQCHGYQGQGSNAGSRLAPNPAPYVAFAHQLRQPRARMPAYSLQLASDQDVADIYAYLLTIPKARAVADIPLLGDGRSP